MSAIPVGSLMLMLLLVAVNGAFVAMEFATVVAGRARIEMLAEQGRRSAQVALGVMGRLGEVLAGTQLGVTIASLGLGAVAEPAIARLLARALGGLGVGAAVADTVGLVVGLGVVVFVHLLFGEMVPKSIALARPEATLMALAIPVSGFVWTFRPVTALLNGMARWGARSLGIQPTDELRASHTAAELEVMVLDAEGEGLIDPEEAELVTRAMRFVDRPVADLMVRRDDIAAVALGVTIEEAERTVQRTGHTRLVVTRPGEDGPDLDAVVGFLHAKDLLALEVVDRGTAVPQDLLRLPLQVSPERTLGPVLVAMRGVRRHVALVSGPDGRTMGLITLEDVLEAIVGDITDESDRG